MNTKLEVGMYVRTRLGIGKIISISEYNATIKFSKNNSMVLPISDTNIKKASYNIIDLIEVGDYVNGKKVISKFNPTFLPIGELPYIVISGNRLEEQDIKSIVTKEQFETIQYKVRE